MRCRGVSALSPLGCYTFPHSLARSSITDDAFAVMFAGFRGSYIAFSSGWAGVAFTVSTSPPHVFFYNLCCRMILDRGFAPHSKSVHDDPMLGHRGIFEPMRARQDIHFATRNPTNRLIRLRPAERRTFRTEHL